MTIAWKIELLKYFGKKLAVWLVSKGKDSAKDISTKHQAEEILREFLTDTGAEDRIEEYLVKLDALNSNHASVHSVRKVVTRTKKAVAKKIAVGTNPKRRVAKKKSAKVAKVRKSPKVKKTVVKARKKVSKIRKASKKSSRRMRR
jgi:hypothetical protein